MFPDWLAGAIGATCKDTALTVGDHVYSPHNGVWVNDAMAVSAAQEQTSDTFGYKWQKKESFESPELLAHVKSWALKRYGDIGTLLREFSHRPVVLDAGCGAALTALELFGEHFSGIKYIGVDISDAVFVARERVRARGFDGVFFKDDLVRLPFSPGGVDCILSEGVLHHTDSTKGALASLAPLIRPGGYFIFYVYNKKGPIREFTDDYIRERLQTMKPEEAWEALRPLTELGIQLGRIDAELDFPDGLPILDVPPGKISLQRFFYWHIFKAFYNPAMAFDEMLHINFDWYAPKNAFRQTPEEVRQWCAELAFDICRMDVEPAGITVVARKNCGA